jgi:uncharacterized membrane protein YagU involved in acid resistance
MATTTVDQASNQSFVRSIIRGAVAGLVGGMVFGMLMAMMNMLPMVGMLVGQENAVVGFIVHMLISAFIGATFGAIATRLPHSWGVLLGAGAAYGMVWWVLGALIMMPLMLGMNEMVFVIGQTQWMSLMGHVIFGLVTGAAFKFLLNRL